MAEKRGWGGGVDRGGEVGMGGRRGRGRRMVGGIGWEVGGEGLCGTGILWGVSSSDKEDKGSGGLKEGRRQGRAKTPGIVL